MTTVSCPKCREQVSIPAGAISHSKVRCPLCQEQYLLTEALQRLPPLLIVVPDTESAAPFVAALPPANESMVDRDIDEAADERAAEYDQEWNLEPVEDRQAGGLPAASPTAEPARSNDWISEVGIGQDRSERVEREHSPSSTRASSMPSRRRHRRKKAGPVKSFIQIIGGGILGLVIAQLILWWMPGDWAKDKRDPLGVADRVAQYAPFLVPAGVRSARMRSNPTVAAKQLPANELPDQQKTSPPEKRYGMQGQENADITNGNIPPVEDKTDAKTNQSSVGEKSNEETKTEATPRAAPTYLTNTLRVPNDPGTDSNVAAKATPSTATDKADSGGTAPATNSDPGALPDSSGSARPIDPEQLVAILSAASSAENAWDKGGSAPLAERKQLFINFYSRFAQLGEALVHVDRADPQVSEVLPKVDQAIEDLSKQSDKLALFGVYVAKLLDQEHEHHGVVLFGTVVEYRSGERIAEMRVRFPSALPSVKQITVLRSATLDRLPLNTKVLVLGTIVPNPRENIAGYEGQESVVAFEGYSLAVHE